ncbi:secretory lipase-like protein 1 precursor [Rhexocercosporidium sp. MPI-PUGE-AT-0058]|nr:secretory lipase-like protein 1 precursor [Rhexocercosporidium sp. MPI-PUGE-AT-0058]
MRFSLFLICTLMQFASILAIPVNEQLASRPAPLPPTDDPFYTPPTDLSARKPGAILRSRSIGPLSLGGSVPFQAKAAYQLLYRTTDTLGDASAAVTTVIIPNKGNSSRLLSYQFAEDAAWANCAPSYTIRLGSNPKNFGSNGVETLFIIAALNRRWIVNLPDYQGLQSAFTSGIQAGQATLDSVRAALASGSLTGVSPEAEYQMWGYSGGSIASEWAAELQPSYAPELNFKGVAIGGVVPNITAVLKAVNKSLFAGLVPAGILGLANAYPDLKAYIDQHLIPSKAQDFKKARTQCLGSSIVTFAGQDMYSYFDTGAAVVNSPIPQSVMTMTGLMGTHGTPKMPIYAYQAVADEVAPIKYTDALVTELCSQGAQIEYIRDALSGHATQEIIGSGDAFKFLIDRFDGVASAPGCRTKTVLSATIDGDGVAELGEIVVGALLAILQRPVAPGTVG